MCVFKLVGRFDNCSCTLKYTLNFCVVGKVILNGRGREGVVVVVGGGGGGGGKLSIWERWCSAFPYCQNGGGRKGEKERERERERDGGGGGGGRERLI